MRLVLLFGIVACVARATTVAIEGNGYVGFHDGAKLVTFPVDGEATVGFDAPGCRMWVAGPAGLALVDMAGARPVAGAAGAVLSDVAGGRFLSRSRAGDAVEVRDTRGDVILAAPAPWARFATRVVLGSDDAWALSRDEKSRRHWLVHLDARFTETASVDLPGGGLIWPNHRLLRDSATGDLWLGQSVGAAGIGHHPRVERRAPDGRVLDTFEWKEKGYFFDFCLEADARAAIVSHDLASGSPFTVPFFSRLERAQAGGKVARHFEGQSNDFLDALACGSGEIFIAERSIFGSDGTTLVRWDGKTAARLARLPAPARRLAACAR